MTNIKVEYTDNISSGGIEVPNGVKRTGTLINVQILSMAQNGTVQAVGIIKADSDNSITIVPVGAFQIVGDNPIKE